MRIELVSHVAFVLCIAASCVSCDVTSREPLGFDESGSEFVGAWTSFGYRTRTYLLISKFTDLKLDIVHLEQSDRSIEGGFSMIRFTGLPIQLGEETFVSLLPRSVDGEQAANEGYLIAKCSVSSNVLHVTLMDIQNARPLVENGTINGKISSESGRARVLLDANSDQLTKVVRVHSAHLFNASKTQVFSRMEDRADKEATRQPRKPGTRENRRKPGTGK